MKKQELFSVAKVETNDTLRDVSRQNLEVYFRITITPNGGREGMTEEQRKLFDQMDEKAKDVVLKGALKHEISNVFKASSFIPNLVGLTEEQLTDDYQNGVVAKLETAFKEKDANGNPRKFLFTYYTYSVEELLVGTAYNGTQRLYDDKDKVLRQRNSLYFGFMDDEENVLSFMRNRLIDAIENGTLSVKPNNVAQPAQPQYVNLSMKPILAITMGDPAGIGPEITVRALNRKETYDKCRPIVTGDAEIMKQAVQLLGFDLQVNAVSNVKDAKFEYGTIDVYDLQCIDLSTFEFGQVQAQCGNAAFQYIKKAIELAMSNEVDGTVTAPLNKEALNLAGHHFDGHTEIYATFTNTKKYAMMLADENIRVIHVSTHVPLRKACDLVKKARVIECVELIDDACRQFGIEKPHIGVAGLNPHSSENGMFGWEEAQEIIPAIEDLRQRGFNVDGPVPPDSVFAKAKCGQFDGVVAMYHDQGHIPLKVCAFNWNKETGKMESASGVNITLGLPIIRVSVDHGTAFDVAGKGIANDSAMTLSIDYATRMAKYRLGIKE